MVHLPTGLSVSCQETRELTANRKIARKMLRNKVDLHFFGEESTLGQRFERERKKKRNSDRRSKKKYGDAPKKSDTVDLGNNDCDSENDVEIEVSEPKSI